MRLTLVIPSMEHGGAERVMSILANSWAEKGHEVTLLTLKWKAKPAYEFHPHVKLRNLGLIGEPTANSLLAAFRLVARIRALRREIRESQPDLVISFMERTNVLTLVATRGLGIPVIVSERVDPRHYDIGRLWQGLRSLTYRWAAALVCQSRTSLIWFEQRMKVKGHVIPNPVLALKERTASLPLKNTEGRTMLAMGRLVDQKGFDLLLDAFGQLAARYPDWSLVILGEGPLRGELEARVRTLHLEHQVQLPGEVPDPLPLLRATDLFVLSSRFEGFPNALCEAMACGLPVVSFDCPSGPAEIVRHGVDGILVPPGDVSALVETLDQLMKDQHERDRLASRALEVVERFSRDKVLLLWEQIFEEVNSSGRLKDRSQEAGT